MIKEKLKEIRELIKNPENWTTGWYYKDASGHCLESPRGYPIKFCLLGATEKICGMKWDSEVSPLFDQYIQYLCNHSLAEFNDLAGHDAVIEMLDELIEREKNLEGLYS